MGYKKRGKECFTSYGVRTSSPSVDAVPYLVSFKSCWTSILVSGFSQVEDKLETELN